MADLGFFQLNDGESANVRILSTTVEKIERKLIHTVDINGSKKKFACLSKNCAFCAHDNEPFERLIVHLYDYKDNGEKVWNRTANAAFLEQLKDIETSWGNLSDCVIKISREGGDFPKYTLTVLNPKLFEDVKPNVDVEVGYRACSYRSNSEIEEFYKTGVMPPHTKRPSQTYVSKSEYSNGSFKNKATQQPPVNRENTSSVAASAPVNIIPEEDDDVFLDPFTKKG